MYFNNLLELKKVVSNVTLAKKRVKLMIEDIKALGEELLEEIGPKNNSRNEKLLYFQVITFHGYTDGEMP